MNRGVLRNYSFERRQIARDCLVHSICAVLLLAVGLTYFPP